MPGPELRGPSPVGPALLAAAAAALFGAGWLADRAGRTPPRLAVLTGRAEVDRRSAVVDQELAPGAALVTQPGGSATLTLGGTEITLRERTALVFRGRLREGRAFRLVQGTVLCEGREVVEVATDLGAARLGGGAFELSLAPFPLQKENPRTLRLAAGRGAAEFDPAVGGGAQFVPAGVAFRAAEWDPLLKFDALLTTEWHRLCGSAPEFADPQTPLEKIPPGAWAPRSPGRNGPVPGMQTGVRMSYSAELGGGVLSGGRLSPEDLWVYDVRAERWARLPRPAVAPAEPAGGSAARGKGGVELRFGGELSADSRTWLRRAGGRWEQLLPPLSPPPRRNGAVYYDPAADLFVVYGGEAPGVVHDDLWVFRAPR